MPKGKVENLKKFPKGKSGNPEGARKHNQVVKAIKRLTNLEIEEIGTQLLTGNKSQFAALASDPEAPMLQQWMAKVILNGTQKSDYKALASILDRVAGKVKQGVELSTDPNAPVYLAPQVVLMLPDNGRSVRKDGKGKG